VVLDARMPDADGLALAARIRERAELATTRIILLTSGDRPGDLARLRELRVNAHLLKPVPQDELRETIHQVLGKDEGRRMKDESRQKTEDLRKGSSSSSFILPPSSFSSESFKILVAEDNEFNAQLLEQLLVRRGHRVRLAGDGREALALAEEGVFDLLLLDLHMPELDGFQVVRAIRERERTAGGHLPIVALTARSRKEDRERCLAAGMDDFLAKPIQADVLWAAIERVLPGERAGRTQEPGPAGTASPSAPAEGLLDPPMVLAACGGDAVILERICQAFRARLPEQVTAVRDALRERDAPRLREAAHKLSGIVAAFSTVAGRVASDLEDRAAAGRLDEAPALVERLEAMARELVPATANLTIETLRRQASQAPGE
jgi:CheY-like chemotaxis protein/HPt (histidine-containing phosphotransfer) domain-containing protein